MGVVTVLVHHGAHGRRVLVVRVVEHVAEVGSVRGIEQSARGVVEVVQRQEEGPAHELALAVVAHAGHEGQGEVEVPASGSRGHKRYEQRHDQNGHSCPQPRVQ